MTNESEKPDKIAEFLAANERAQSAGARVVQLANELLEEYSVEELVKRTGLHQEFWVLVERRRDGRQGRAQQE